MASSQKPEKYKIYEKNNICDDVVSADVEFRARS